MTKHLYFVVAVFVGLVLAGPLLAQLVVAVVPWLVLAAIAAVVVRLVWFYTNRY